jgi:hypothetical protein
MYFLKSLDDESEANTKAGEKRNINRNNDKEQCHRLPAGVKFMFALFIVAKASLSID